MASSSGISHGWIRPLLAWRTSTALGSLTADSMLGGDSSPQTQKIFWGQNQMRGQSPTKQSKFGGICHLMKSI
ncbi:unnamed protein product [Victoria cruziana]